MILHLMFQLIQTVKLKVELETEVPNLAIYYSFDETNPDEFYPKYEKPLNHTAGCASFKSNNL